MSTFKSDLLLLFIAILWGSGYLAQQAGAQSLPPMLFGALRFSLAALCILPLLSYTKRHSALSWLPPKTTSWRTGMIAGFLMFIGTLAQQVSLASSSIANVGFITGFMVILVPILEWLIWRKKAGTGVWLGAGLALWGIYFLCIQQGFQIASGDFIAFTGSLCWASHLIYIGHKAPNADPIRLAFLQFIFCALFGFIGAALFEPFQLKAIQATAVPLLWGGIMSIGVGFTVQVIVQQYANSAHTAVILSMEALFAGLFGWLLLNETLTPRAILGCGLMFSGMLTAQLWNVWFQHQTNICKQ